LLSLSVLWGGSFFFAKVALAELSPLSVVFGRVALAAARTESGSCLFGRETPVPAQGAPGGSFAAMGMLNNMVPFGLDLLGPDADRLGSRLDPQRHDAALHPGRGARRSPEGRTDRRPSSSVRHR
jgi:hypothetical protein